MTNRIAVGTPVNVSSKYGQHAGRNDLVVLSDQGTGYGVGPKGNDPAKSHNGAEGWLYYSDSSSRVTPKEESKTVTQFTEGDKVEFIEDYPAGPAKIGDRATVLRVDYPEDGNSALVRFMEDIEGACAYRLKLIEEPKDELKVGDKVVVEKDFPSYTWHNTEGVITGIRSRGNYLVKLTKAGPNNAKFVTVGTEYNLNGLTLLPPFTFKDIQVGDNIRRTLTRKSGAKEVREGTVSKVASWYVEDDSYILAYDTDTADAKDVTLELLNRPVPPKKPWEDAERGTVIKRGEDHLVRNAGGWLFIYTNGSKVQRSQKDTEVLLRGEEDLQVTPA